MSWITWSPMQSPETAEICAHLTPSEESRLMTRSGAYGLWCGVSFAFPITWLGMSLAGLFPSSPSRIGVAIALIVAHVVFIPKWQRNQKKYLCSTQWAREQGYTPEKLKLLSIKRKL